MKYKVWKFRTIWKSKGLCSSVKVVFVYDWTLSGDIMNENGRILCFEMLIQFLFINVSIWESISINKNVLEFESRYCICFPVF